MTVPVTNPLTAVAALERSFRAALGNLPSGVTVVTTFDGDVPHGTTVSAVMSLSLEPPMVVVSLDLASSLRSRIDVGSRIGVNVLAADQDQIGLRFATKVEDRFADIGWFADGGAPRIVDSHAWVLGNIGSIVTAGDHDLLLLDVVAAQGSPGRPLTYWQRSFGTHVAF